MATPLLITKLYIPPVTPQLVPRPRLIDLLNAGLDRKLALISAPAGFGKTTLLSEWVIASERPVAWLSLDKSDNDPARFWAYFIAALQTVQTDIGEPALAMVQSAQPPPIEAILGTLMNEIAVVPDGFALVLDDYHVIEAQPIHDAMAFLLDHLPPQMHLVITSRSDPPLPLPRLRGRGQLTELRVAHLRFVPDEAADFLNQVMGLALSSDEVAALETRTEGWIAGLLLAALSLQGQDAPRSAAFISAFTGDDRYIVDYLVDEVLAQRPKGTKDFLLQTSILDRMTGPLCDAVAGHEGGQEILERLEQANLFIVPLDNERRWYRYHHLFADLLRQRLQESTTPQDMKSLHQRASEWHEENGFLIEAVEHALAAGDYDSVIRQIEQGEGQMFQSSQLNTLLRWWAQLPQELATSRPKLCMIYGWACVATGHPEEAEHCLQAIERALDTQMTELHTEGEEAEAMDPAVRAALVEVAVVRAELAMERSNIPEALKLSRLVLPYLEEEGPYLHHPPKDLRSVVLFIMGRAHKVGGELSAADKALSEAATLGHEQGNVHIVAVAFGHLASVQATQGHLRQAVLTCQRGLQLLQEMAGRPSPMSGVLQAELGNLLYKQNDVEAALHHLQEGIAVAKPWGFWDALVPGYTGLARLRVARGDWGGAFAALDELAALGQDSPEAVMPAVESFRAMLWAAQGKVDAASRWAQTASLDVDREINFLREGEFTILVRVLIAEKKWPEAARLIDRLMDATETGKRWGRVIELLILRALVLDAQGKRDEALESLTGALSLAKPEGYVRVFVDEGEPMAEMLREAGSRGVALDYVVELLAAYQPDTIPREPPATIAPIEPLSKRELEVLRLLRTELSGPEIARELVIALSTMRTHTQNIYTKLNVNNRRAAVNRAEELNLI